MRVSTIPPLLLLILFFLLCHGTPANSITGIANLVSNVLKSYMQKCKQLDILKWDTGVLNINQVLYSGIAVVPGQSRGLDIENALIDPHGRVFLYHPHSVRI